MSQEPLTCFTWSFEGAPPIGERAPGWIAIPGADRQVALRATAALARATCPWLSIHRCLGQLGPAGDLVCADAAQIARVDASAQLRAFARYCAVSVLGLWSAPDCVERYVRSGAPGLAAAAHREAWEMSNELTGVARLAARVAMYAAHPDQVVLSTRQAANIATAIACATSLEAAEESRIRQERTLAAALHRLAPHARHELLATVVAP